MGHTDVDDIYELSPLQRGMLLHTVHDGSADMYLGQHVYVIDGPLDADLLVRAWRQVFESHPALRTSFHWEGLDKPLQVVHREVTPPSRTEDWSGVPEDEQQERLDRLLAEDRATGFDLTAPPLQRLYLVRLRPERHALAWTHHHLLLDGWSVPVFMNEVMAHYQGIVTGGPRPAPAPAFREYIAWLDQQDMDAARRFWSETLGGVSPHPLPGLRALDPRHATGEPGRRSVDIAGRLEDGLRAAAARHRVTVGTVLHGAWAAVLSRLTHSSDVLFGCVSSGRPADLPDVDRMIGMFVNTLPVAVDVPGDGDLGEWLRDVQARAAAAREYEFSPLSDVKRWAGVPGRQLFDSLVVFANYSFGVGEESAVAGQLSVRSQRTFDKVSVPLALIVNPAPVSELELLWHEDRFDAHVVDDVLALLLAVLGTLPDADRTSALLAAGDAHTEASCASAPAPTGAPLPAAPVPADGRGRTSAPVPPATPEEEHIASAWRETLGLEELDVTANFFDLGGDSFTAVRAVGRIEGATVAMLALHPTVRDLAAALAAVGPDEEDRELDAEIAELERRLAETGGPVGTPAADTSVETRLGATAAPSEDRSLQEQLTAYYEGPGREQTLEQESSGHGALEFERTKEIVLRHLPPAPAVVADIGGGPGRFALWLAELGYEVLHREIVPSFVDEVNRAAQDKGLAVESAVGDARWLDLDDESVDAVLLLGPLYYLPSEEDRLAVLREARRVVRPGGPVYGAGISRWASRMDGMLRERMYERGPQMLELIAAVEQTGVLPSAAAGGYTAFTHLPRQLATELEAAELEVTDLVSVEGAAFLVDDLSERMADPRAREAVLAGARAQERVPELLGLGPHLVATGVRR